MRRCRCELAAGRAAVRRSRGAGRGPRPPCGLSRDRGPDSDRRPSLRRSGCSCCSTTMRRRRTPLFVRLPLAAVGSFRPREEISSRRSSRSKRRRQTRRRPSRRAPSSSPGRCSHSERCSARRSTSAPHASPWNARPRSSSSSVRGSGSESARSELRPDRRASRPRRRALGDRAAHRRARRRRPQEPRGRRRAQPEPEHGRLEPLEGLPQAWCQLTYGARRRSIADNPDRVNPQVRTVVRSPGACPSWSVMTTYLVERYLPGRDRAWLEEALARLRETTRTFRTSARSTSLPTNRASAGSRAGRRERPAHQRAGRGAVRPNRGRRRTRRQPQRRTAMRFFGLIAVLVVAGSIAAASAQTQTRSGHHGKGRPTSSSRTRSGSRPACRTWSASSEATSSASSEGRVYERTVTGNTVYLDAIYIVIAPDPARSFTAHVKGTEDLTTLKAVLERPRRRRLHEARARPRGVRRHQLHAGAERHLFPGHDQRQAWSPPLTSGHDPARRRGRRAGSAPAAVAADQLVRRAVRDGAPARSRPRLG